jgi:bifunctional non-homologous end joining protein LigD
VSLPGYRPMLATPWPEPFRHDDWSFETKWDGIRALVSWDGAVGITGRRGNDVTERYPELAGLRGERPFVVDGEIIALGDDGLPSFERLQQRMGLSDARAARRATAEVPVTLVVFDVLYDGSDATAEPYRDRRTRLEALHLPPPAVVGDATAGDGFALWDAVVERGLEGIVAKQLDSPYRSGIRSADWRKIAHIRAMRAVVGGFTAGEGGRARSFGSLLLGLWDRDHLGWIGSVGTGFSDRDLTAIRSALDEMVRPACPFAPDPDLPAATWVEPLLVASIGFREWTSAGRIRHPRFRGFTDDPAATATWESEGPG